MVVQQNSRTHRGYNPSAALERLRKSEDGRVYVLNTSDLDGRRDKGVVNFGVTQRNGEQRNVIVPNTWIPVDLSQQMPKEELLSSPPFLSNVMKQVVRIVANDEADQLLARPENVQEQDRIYQEYMSLISPEMDIDTQLQQGRQRGQQPQMDIEDEDEPQAVGVNPKVQEAVGREDLNYNQRFAVLRNNEAQLTKKDLQYVINNSDERRLVEFAVELMQNRGWAHQTRTGGYVETEGNGE